MIIKQNRSRTVEQLESHIRTPVFPQRSSGWSPQFPDVFRLLLKEEGMLHSVTSSTVK